MPTRFQIQVQIAKSAALSLLSTGIRRSRLADTTESRNHPSTQRILRQIAQNARQNRIRLVPGQLEQPPRERSGFDEYHRVILLCCSSIVKRRLAALHRDGELHIMIPLQKIYGSLRIFFCAQVSVSLNGFARSGEVSERFKEHAWKACVGETQPWVQIPPSPP